MKNFGALILLVYSFFPALAQQTETREPDTFSGVKVAEGIDVYLRQGDKELVKVEVTGTEPANIITEVSGSYLKIHMRDGRYRTVDAKVYVTYVELSKLSASSAGSIFSEGTIKAGSLEISASSAGSIEVTIDAESVDVSASSAGDVELKGKAESIHADASSAGEIDAYDLESNRVDAGASTAGTVKIHVTGNLDAKASSGGTIRYRGNPDRSNTNSTSGGSVRKSN